MRNYLHVWLNRHADGLMRRSNDAYKPLIDEKITQQESNSCWANILRLAFASEGG